jgi:uncharacterized membrane protein YfcA
VGDLTSLVVHGIVFLFGLFGIGVSVILVSVLLFIGSAITLGAVAYSMYSILVTILNKKHSPA